MRRETPPYHRASLTSKSSTTPTTSTSTPTTSTSTPLGVWQVRASFHEGLWLPWVHHQSAREVPPGLVASKLVAVAVAIAIVRSTCHLLLLLLLSLLLLLFLKQEPKVDERVRVQRVCLNRPCVCLPRPSELAQ